MKCLKSFVILPFVFLCEVSAAGSPVGPSDDALKRLADTLNASGAGVLCFTNTADLHPSNFQDKVNATLLKLSSMTGKVKISKATATVMPVYNTTPADHDYIYCLALELK